MSVARHLLRCGGPDMVQETGHRLVFHHAIIHENKHTAVKNLLRPPTSSHAMSQERVFLQSTRFYVALYETCFISGGGVPRTRRAGAASAYPH